MNDEIRAKLNWLNELDKSEQRWNLILTQQRFSGLEEKRIRELILTRWRFSGSTERQTRELKSPLSSDEIVLLLKSQVHSLGELLETAATLENQMGALTWSNFAQLQLVCQLCPFLAQNCAQWSMPWFYLLQCALLGATHEKCSEAAASAESCS